MNDKNFISCDWGSTSFRLRLVEAATKNVLAETKSEQGIAATFALWKESVGTDKISFYSNIILQQLALLENQVGHSLDGVTIIISGMASATIGMIELPYQLIPFEVNKAVCQFYVVEASQNCPHKIILISGACSSNDVMRGEETMLAGCAGEVISEEQLFIFPGTHSKHIVVQNGILKDFKTYMTGELFDLLNSKSMLANSVEINEAMPENMNVFLKGVKESIDSILLNTIFHVRTSGLLNGTDKKSNYHYLSGLLIGEELKNISAENYPTVTIVSTGVLLNLYTKALSALDYKGKLLQADADSALIRGQAFVFNQYH